jgi:hypothetical protein
VAVDTYVSNEWVRASRMVAEERGRSIVIAVSESIGEISGSRVPL